MIAAEYGEDSVSCKDAKLATKEGEVRSAGLFDKPLALLASWRELMRPRPKGSVRCFRIGRESGRMGGRSSQARIADDECVAAQILIVMKQKESGNETILHS
jgi:hypothetical protein